MKKYLENFIKRKQEAIAEMRKRVQASDDINEVRSLGDQIAAAQEEIEEARAKLAECNTRMDGIRADLNEGQEEGQEDGQDADEEEQPALDNNARSRNFAPGRVVGGYDTRNAAQNRGNMERRAKEFAQTGRQSVPVNEARATLISGGKIATPTEVGGINNAFTQVSSIVDMVKVTDCLGMGAYKVAYEIASATAATQTEGAAVAESDMQYDFVTITPQTEAVVSYISKQVRKQSPLNYTAKVRESALTALRKRAAEIITNKIKASALVDKLTVTAIDETTLRKLALSYGGTEGIEGNATLQLCKADLIKFGDVRGENEKLPVYEITPNTANPNTGIIKDGGLSVPYCLNGNLAANELIYGNLNCFELALFSDYEITLSEDRNIEKLMLTVVGDVELGGEVVVNKGFVVTSATA